MDSELLTSDDLSAAAHAPRLSANGMKSGKQKVGVSYEDKDMEQKPWWQHRWPWLLMLGPAVAIVACIITIVLAFNAYGDQDISDGSSRHGLVVSAPDK